MTYLVDSSCFMTASQTSYPFDIAESFWNKIAELAQNHAFYSIDKVEDEINANLPSTAVYYISLPLKLLQTAVKYTFLVFFL